MTDPVIARHDGRRWVMPDGTPMPDHVKTYQDAVDYWWATRGSEARDPRLGLAIVLAGAMLAVGFGWYAWARWLDKPAPSPATVAPLAPDCPTPAAEGDRTVIVVRLVGERLVTTCQRLNDWRDPARKP